MLGEGDTPNALSVPGQDGDLLVNLRVPQPDRVIHAAAGECAAIRTCRSTRPRISPQQFSLWPFPAATRGRFYGDVGRVPLPGATARAILRIAGISGRSA